MTNMLQAFFRERARERSAGLQPERTAVVLTPRVRTCPKYAPRVSRYLGSLQSPTVHGSLDDAIAGGDLERAELEVLRVHPNVRRATGTPIYRASSRRVKGLLRRGRVLSRDAAFLAQAVQALQAGASAVRLGTPESLADGSATTVVAPEGDA